MFRTLMLAALLALPLAASAQQDGARSIPGLTINEAQIVGRPGPGSFLVRAEADVRPREVEAGIASICGRPSRAVQLFRDPEGRPADITWLVRCA